MAETKERIVLPTRAVEVNEEGHWTVPDRLPVLKMADGVLGEGPPTATAHGSRSEDKYKQTETAFLCVWVTRTFTTDLHEQLCLQITQEKSRDNSSKPKQAKAIIRHLEYRKLYKTYGTLLFEFDNLYSLYTFR